jgi:hypothetical protein
MPFEFVDNNAAIDRAARKRIRSHVALGRNAGKTLIRPSRKKALGVKTTTLPALICMPEVLEDAHAHDSESVEDTVPEIQRQIGDGLSIFSFPVRLTPGSKSLVLKSEYGCFTPQCKNINRASLLIIVQY